LRQARDEAALIEMLGRFTTPYTAMAVTAERASSRPGGGARFARVRRLVGGASRLRGRVSSLTAAGTST
jgi:hypothetical protein